MQDYSKTKKHVSTTGTDVFDPLPHELTAPESFLEVSEGFT